MSKYKRNIDNETLNRKMKLQNRMGTTSSCLKDYEQLLSRKEAITLYLELFLIIVSIIVSLAKPFDWINSNLINIIITIIIINFGRINYPLQKHKIRDAYLAIDRLFTDVDNANSKEDVTLVEYEYNNMFNLTENVPNYLYQFKLTKQIIKKIFRNLDSIKFTGKNAIKLGNIIWGYLLNLLYIIIYLLSDIVLTIIVIIIALCFNYMNIISSIILLI